MTLEAQRIAIAEACGWSRGKSPYAGADCWCKNDGYKMTLPDYLNDLNAMHEAEKVLNPEQQINYASRLARYFKDNSTHGSDFLTDFDLLHATAAQRAEAFLKTIGKWNPSTPTQSAAAS